MTAAQSYTRPVHFTPAGWARVLGMVAVVASDMQKAPWAPTREAFTTSTVDGGTDGCNCKRR